MQEWKFSDKINKALINTSLVSYFLFIGLLIVSMYYYPGSNHLDKNSEYYSITHNFLSDLGYTIVYSGAQNFISSTLFVFATTFVCIGLITYFLAVPSLMNEDLTCFRLTQLGSIAGIICGFAFMGVGFTPYNYYPDEHMFFVRLGFQLFLFVMLMHSFAIMKNKNGINKNTIWIYLVFMCVLAFQIYLINWGPSVNEDNGLMLKVVWQKVTVVGLSTTVFVQAFIFKNHIPSLTNR